jgi:uncharacterized protein YecT (DUF1311 family)
LIVKHYQISLSIFALGSAIMPTGPAIAQHMNAPSAPCQEAESMVDTSNCMAAAYRQADAELNDTYRQIMAVLRDAEKVKLRSAQRAWISYRDLACEAEAEPFRGRSGGGIARTACLEAATRARTSFLRAGLWWKVEKFAD